jgi:hypothetical protein
VYERRSARRRDTRLARGQSPKTIACVGQVCAQAGVTSPSASLRPAFFASIFAFWMRCTQNVHFSITPRERTVTSGL